MTTLDKIITILDKQLINIQVLQRKSTKYYIGWFKRAVDMVKKLKEEIEGEIKMEDKKIFCVDCGAKLSNDMNFCPKCGKKV